MARLGRTGGQAPVVCLPDSGGGARAAGGLRHRSRPGLRPARRPAQDRRDSSWASTYWRLTSGRARCSRSTWWWSIRPATTRPPGWPTSRQTPEAARRSPPRGAGAQFHGLAARQEDAQRRRPAASVKKGAGRAVRPQLTGRAVACAAAGPVPSAAPGRGRPAHRRRRLPAATRRRAIPDAAQNAGYTQALGALDGAAETGRQLGAATTSDPRHRRRRPACPAERSHSAGRAV